MAIPSRIWLIGCSGSGKSTLGRQLAERLKLPLHELDGLFHQAGWKPLPDAEFCERVSGIIQGERWILDGNYFLRTNNLVATRAELVIWLDYARLLTFSRVLRRSLRRVITGEEVWNGNRESWRGLLDPRPEENVVLWSWTQHSAYRERYTAAMEAGRFGEAEVLRFRSPRSLKAWLHGLG